MTAPAGGKLIDALYYEISIVADGMKRGAAEGVAAVRQIETAADKASAAVDRIGQGPSNRNQRNTAIAELNEAFKAGAISQAEYEKQATSLGVKLVTLSNAGKAAAASFVAQGEAATAAGAASAIAATETVAASTASRLLSGALAVFSGGAALTAAVTLGLGLIAAAYKLITGRADEAKEHIESVIDALERQRLQAARTSIEGLRNEEPLAADRVSGAQRDLADAQRGVTTRVDRLTGKVTTIGEDKVRTATDALNVAKREQKTLTEQINKLELDGAEKTAQALGKALSAGNANNEVRRQANSLITTYSQQITDLVASGKGDQVTLDQINKLQGMVDNLSAAGKKADKSAETADGAARRLREAQARALQGFDSAIASLTPDKSDNIEEQIKRLTAAAVAAHVGVSTIQQKIAELRAAAAASIQKQSKDLTAQLRKELAATTVSKVDDLRQGLAEFDKKIADDHAKGINADPAIVKQLRDAKVEAIALTAEAERLAGVLRQIDEAAAEGGDMLLAAKLAIAELDNATKARDALPKGSPQRAAAEEKVQAITARIVKLQNAIADANERNNKALAETDSRTQRLAGNVANIANAAFGLASAFAGANSQLAKMLGGVGQVAGGIESIFAAANKKDKDGNSPGLGGLLKTGSGIASLLPGLGQAIGGALALGATLFGKSPEEQARIQRQKENTTALEQLSKHIGDLGKNITGTDFASVRSAVGNANLTGLYSTDQLSRVLGKNLSDLGLSFKDLAELAKVLGVSIDTTRIQFKDVAAIQEAIRKSELGQFADTFAGQLAKMDAEARLFDITDPIAQLKRFRAALEGIGTGGKGGILAETIDAFNTSTPEGIAAAIKSLQDLFTAITSGQIDPSRFGGLTGQELIDAIEKTKNLLTSGAQAGTGGFNTVQTITETTGARIPALLSTANIFAEEIAGNTAEIVRRLGGAVAGLSLVGPPPSLMPGSSSSSSVSLNFAAGAIQITLTGAEATTQRATAFAQYFTDAAVKEMDTKLGDRMAWAKRARGDVTVY